MTANGDDISLLQGWEGLRPSSLNRYCVTLFFLYSPVFYVALRTFMQIDPLSRSFVKNVPVFQPQNSRIPALTLKGKTAKTRRFILRFPLLR